MNKRITIEESLQKIPTSEGKLFATVLEHGSLVVEMYKPYKVDLQTPHTRDEIYVVISGSGTFINGEVRHPFGIGDVLFVPAGIEHRFIEFTDDFMTWVMFYGPEGGEKA